MDFLDSLAFLENNWDQCSKDEMISAFLNDPSINFDDQIQNQEMQFLSEIQAKESTINQLNKSISHLSNSLEMNSQRLDNSLQFLRSLSPHEPNEKDEKEKQELKDIITFSELVYPFCANKIRFIFPPPTDIEPRFSEAINILTQYVQLNQFLSKNPSNEPYQDSLKRTIQNGFSLFQSNLDIVYQTLLSYFKSFFSQVPTKSSLSKLSNYKTFYGYLVILFRPSKTRSFQKCCSDQSASAIFQYYFPPKKLTEIFHPDTFNYESEHIKKLLHRLAKDQYQDTDLPDNAQNYDEFRIIHFFLRLPVIIRDYNNIFHNIFGDGSGPLSDFVDEISKEYRKYICSSNVFNGDHLTSPLFWSFLYRIIFYHRQFKFPSELMQKNIDQLLELTENVALNNAKLLFKNFFQDHNKYLDIEYQKIFTKHSNKKIKDKQYIKELNEFFVKLIYPLRKSLFEYFDVVVQLRKEDQWYKFMNYKLAQNPWFTSLTIQMQSLHLFTDFDQFKSFPKDIMFPYFCMLNHYFYFLGLNVDLCFHFEKKMEDYILTNLNSLDHLKEIKYFFKIDLAFADQTLDPATYFTDNYGLFYSNISKFIKNAIDIVEKSDITKKEIENNRQIIKEFIARLISLFGKFYTRLEKKSQSPAFRNIRINPSTFFIDSLKKEFNLSKFF